MNKPYFCRNFFLTHWRHKRLKNKIGLFLFYREHLYGFSESVRRCGSEDVMVLVCHVILQDHVTKRFCDFMGRSVSICYHPA